MSELRDQHKAFAEWFLTQNPIAPSPEDMAWAAWKAALAEPKTELRDQHKAFTHWYFGLRGINEANFNPEYLAWAAWKAALAQPEAKPVAWESRWIDPEEGPGDWVPTRDPDFYRSRPNYEVRPLYAHPPRDEWRPASEPPDSEGKFIVWFDYDNPGAPLFDVVWYLKPGGWQALNEERITHWRDVQPPTESTIATEIKAARDEIGRQMEVTK